MSSEKEFWAGVICALERIANALEQQSTGTADGFTATSCEPTTSTQSRAMVWCAITGCTDNAEIAKQFEVTQRTVRRWHALQELLISLKGISPRKAG